MPANGWRQPQGSADGRLRKGESSARWLEASPQMDSWIMGLLYALIVGGSGAHGPLRGKGLGRSACPTGGMYGRSPAEDRLDSRLWVRRERRGKSLLTVLTVPSFCWSPIARLRGGKTSSGPCSCLLFYFFFMCFANLSFAKGFLH